MKKEKRGKKEKVWKKWKKNKKVKRKIKINAVSYNPQFIKDG